MSDLNYFYKKNTIYNEFINYFFKKLFFLKNKEKIFTKLKLTYSKSNMHLNVLSSKLIYSLSIGEFMSIIGKQNAIWKKKNPRYKDLIFNFFVKLLIYTKFYINFFIIKNIKNSFFIFFKYFKKVKYDYMYIKDTINFTKIKLKKKTYLKRRISRKLIYVNPLKT